MANRLYIGARYVPVPFNNPDGSYNWLPGVAYEGLTIVIYDHRSYISKKPVPAISTPPSEDTDHWVDAYLFNADVAEALLSIEELQETKADKDGVYASLWAGELISKDRQTDNTPYLLRETGGDLKRIAPLCYPTLVGASVGENQLVQNGDFADPSNWITQFGGISVDDNVLTYTPTTIQTSYYDNQVRQTGFNVPTNHVIFLSCDTFAPYSNGFYYSVRTNNVGQSGVGITNKPLTPNEWNHTEKITKSNNTITDIAFYWSMNTNYQIGDSVKLRNVNFIDLTQLLGSTIADYAYSLEQQTAGSGIAWLRSYGFITDDYKPYNTGTLESVEATAKVVRDENNENAVTYPLGSDVLRGIFKLDANNKLYADGDRKTSDGTITRYYGTRAYQEGDESLADAITDGTTTVYKLSTPTTEISTPFTSPQVCYPEGTEEFVTENGVPVGHETEYPYDLKGLIEGLIDVPDVPSNNGTYKLQAVRTSSGVTYDWVTD